MWRSILEGIEVLALELIKRIGNGTGTNIWQENHFSRDFKLGPICARSDNPPSLVAELIDTLSRLMGALC